MMPDAPVLSVRNLRVEFPTRRGTLVAVDDVSFDIAPGEVLGIVGESGAGKSLTGAAIIGLLEPPGRIAGGEVLLRGQRIDNLPRELMRPIRGKRIGMVFQDPLTSLNPLYRVGDQIIETIRTHLPLNESAARTRAIELLTEVGIQGADQRIDPIRTSSRRNAPARRPRPRVCAEPEWSSPTSRRPHSTSRSRRRSSSFFSASAATAAPP